MQLMPLIETLIIVGVRADVSLRLHRSAALASTESWWVPTGVSVFPAAAAGSPARVMRARGSAGWVCR